MSRGLPVTLTHLDDMLCIVVGGGVVAERKVSALLEAGARVRLIAPELTEALTAQVQASEIEWLPRPFQPGDLENALLVIAATDDARINRAVASEALDDHLLVNVVDDPEVSNFISPAVVRRGDLTIATCTGGTVPALSAQLRARFDQEFGKEWEAYVEWLARIRDWLKTRYPDFTTRREAWARVLQSDIKSYIECHSEDQVQAHVIQLLEN